MGISASNLITSTPPSQYLTTSKDESSNEPEVSGEYSFYISAYKGYNSIDRFNITISTNPSLNNIQKIHRCVGRDTTSHTTYAIRCKDITQEFNILKCTDVNTNVDLTKEWKKVKLIHHNWRPYTHDQAL